MKACQVEECLDPIQGESGSKTAMVEIGKISFVAP